MKTLRSLFPFFIIYLTLVFVVFLAIATAQASFDISRWEEKARILLGTAISLGFAPIVIIGFIKAAEEFEF